MLAASSLRNPDDDRETQMEGFEEFFDRIDSRDLFVGMDEVESLPDLEIVSDILTEFSIPSINVKGFSGKPEEKTEEREDSKRLDPSQTNENRVDSVEWNPEKDKKSNSKISTSTTTFQTKRKTKVDWTPELHRRFVQAVEQLGIDKAVPSRILELMGMDFLTRHNIASHLQKYRSHRKNMMARETANSLTQRRQLYSRINGDMKPWIAPNVSLSPPALQDFRSFHAWGHPLPKHSFCSLPQSTTAMIPSPETFQWKVHAFAPGAFYFSQPRYSVAAAPETPSAQVILPHNSRNSAEVGSVKSEVKLITSKETIDATIGDVLKKPWLPLPLGLKPPSVESVLSELQRQGISHISLPSSTLS